MAIRAHVNSMDAVKRFRSDLIVYVSKSRPALEELNSEVVRIRVWLETEQRTFWENEVKRRTRKLEEARAALFSSRISNLREVSSAEKMAVTRAENALAEAEGKLRSVKRWSREFDGKTEPLLRQLEKMNTLLANDMPNAIAFLAKTIESLESYAHIKTPVVAAPTPGSSSGEAPPRQGDQSAEEGAGGPVESASEGGRK